MTPKGEVGKKATESSFSDDNFLIEYIKKCVNVFNVPFTCLSVCTLLIELPWEFCMHGNDWKNLWDLNAWTCDE